MTPVPSTAPKKPRVWLLAVPLWILVAAMFVYPALMVVRTSVAAGEEIGSPGFTLNHYVTFFTDSLYRNALVTTLLLAVFATVICAMVGLIYAYEIVRKPRFRNLMLTLLVLPLLVNGVVRIFGLQLGMISVDQLLVGVGVLKSPMRLQYSFPGIVIALSMFQFPFMTLAIYSGLSRLDGSLIEAAQTLGANQLSILARIVFPMAVPGLVAGSVLTFAGSAGSFITPAMMGGGRINTIPQMIYTSVSQGSQWATASAFAVILVAILLISILNGLRAGLRRTASSR